MYCKANVPHTKENKNIQPANHYLSNKTSLHTHKNKQTQNQQRTNSALDAVVAQSLAAVVNYKLSIILYN